MPWLNKVHQRYAAQGLVMVGVHTPEFFYERGKRAVEAEVKRHELRYPQLIDKDGVYWEAAGNRAWPAVYLIDRDGRVFARYTGTIRDGDERSRRIESELEAALR